MFKSAYRGADPVQPSSLGTSSSSTTAVSVFPLPTPIGIALTRPMGAVSTMIAVVTAVVVARWLFGRLAGVLQRHSAVLHDQLSSIGITRRASCESIYEGRRYN